MRIGLIALLHESNTFVGGTTGLRLFQEDVLAVGEAMVERFTGAHHEIGGFFDGLREAGVEPVPILAARACPSGVIEAATLDPLVAVMRERLREAAPLDGLLVAPHGAAVSEHQRDADGHWLSRVRETVGSGMPIVGTLDPHANLSPAMVASTDALIAYRTNPHLDQRERGLDAARLVVRAARGEARPCQAAAFPPIALGIQRQATDEPPCASLMAAARALETRDGVLAASVLLGFPYADVAEMGSSALVVADGDRATAERAATELGEALWSLRGGDDLVDNLIGELVGVEGAVDRALRLSPDGPVCLLDMGDNVGGGSPGDGTIIARELRRRGVPGSLVCLFDPAAASLAASAGAGARIDLEIGGKTDDVHGEPLGATFEVVRLAGGRFEEPEPRHGGLGSVDQGRCAVLRTDDDLTVLVTSRRVPPFSLRQLTSCGIDPAAFRVVVAKGVNAPIAAYAPVCRHFIRVDTPGVTTADMRRLDHVHRRRPMAPFERDAAWG